MVKKVLIVDDELDVRVFMSTLLETSGYRPIVAEDGIHGLEQARKSKPALIIMDVMMPKESGIHMYRELKRDPQLQSIPIIMVTALSRKTFDHSHHVLDEYEGDTMPPPNAYIEKPPEAEELLAAVRDVLGQ